MSNAQRNVKVSSNLNLRDIQISRNCSRGLKSPKTEKSIDARYCFFCVVEEIL